MIEVMEIRPDALLIVAAGTASNNMAFRVRVDEVEWADESAIRFVGIKVRPSGEPVIEWSCGERVPAARFITARAEQLTAFIPIEK